MKSSTKKILIIGGAAVAGYFVWQYFQQQQQAGDGTAPAAGASPGLTALPAASVTMPAPAAATTAPASPAPFVNSAGTSVPAWIQAWGQQTGVDAPIYVSRVWPNISYIDVQNLMNVVTNYFNTGLSLTPSLTAWWDSFVSKYGLQ
jgi:hypothetical protein